MDDSINGDYYDYMGYDVDMSANGQRMVAGARRGGYEGYAGRVLIFDIPNRNFSFYFSVFAKEEKVNPLIEFVKKFISYETISNG